MAFSARKNAFILNKERLSCIRTYKLDMFVFRKVNSCSDNKTLCGSALKTGL